MSTLTTTQTKVLTNEALKEILTDTVCGRNMADDMDTCKAAGTYYVSHLTANRPEEAYQWGVLLVFTCNNGILIQMYYPREQQRLYIRMCYDLIWTPWKVFNPS